MVLINEMEGGIVSIIVVAIGEYEVNSCMVCTAPLNLTFDYPAPLRVWTPLD